MFYDPSWPDKLARQDEILFFDHFNNDDALRLGLSAIEEGRRFGKAFAIRIIANGATVFSYHMEGTGMFHDWWMDKKLNMSREAGMSTLRLFSEIQAGLREKPAQLEDENNYATDGGCVPLRMRDGRIFGYMIASGASHELDHEVVVRSVAKLLGVTIPTVAE